MNQIGQPDSLVEYQHYMRINGYVWSVTPVEGEVGFGIEFFKHWTRGRWLANLQFHIIIIMTYVLLLIQIHPKIVFFHFLF